MLPGHPAARDCSSEATAGRGLGTGVAGCQVLVYPRSKEGWLALGQGRGARRSPCPGPPEGKPWLSLPQEAELERLEREFAIQSQITEAARRLASDPNVSKKLKKQRKTSYLNALKKLQEIENAINENRIKSGKKPTQRASLIIDGQCPAHTPAARCPLCPGELAPVPQVGREPPAPRGLSNLLNHPVPSLFHP